jgi:TRAP-type transport system small permease protein
MLDRLTQVLTRWTRVISVGMFMILLFCIFLAVFDRFLLHIGFFWTEELARFIFIWLCFLTAAIMVQRREHFAVPFLDLWLSPKGQRVKEFITSGVMVGVMGIILVYGIKLAEAVQFQTSPALGLSMKYVYYAAPVTAVLMIIFFIGQLIHIAKKPLEGKKES